MTVVHTGIDRVASGEVHLPRGHRLGLVTNRAAQTSSGEWTGDALRTAGYHIALILTPEHGLDALADAGAPIGHGRIDALPILSLYGADPAPVEEAMATVEALVIDLPDVGCRYYTYPWTVRRVLALAARHRVPVFLLDRPNPLRGSVIEGNLPDGALDSAVCASWVPVVHGLTSGELARWNQRHFSLEVDLFVIPVEGWTRATTWEGTGLPWVAPSPALPTIDAARIYPGTCLLEGTNISEGRGTDHSFAWVGAPFLDGGELAARLSSDDAFAGAGVAAIEFIPSSSKWAGDVCRGVAITIHDNDRFRPVRAGLALVAAICRFPEFTFRPAHFDALAGSDAWRVGLESGLPAATIASNWEESEQTYRTLRTEILQYA